MLLPLSVNLNLCLMSQQCVFVCKQVCFHVQDPTDCTPYICDQILHLRLKCTAAAITLSLTPIIGGLRGLGGLYSPLIVLCNPPKPGL